MTKGVFEKAKGAKPGFPPVLVIEFDKDDNLYPIIKKHIDQEMFLRYRILGPKLSKIVINSVSDIEKLEADKEPNINLEIDVVEINKDMIDKINRSPVWIMALVTPSEFLTVAVEKESELIVKRRVEKL